MLDQRLKEDERNMMLRNQEVIRTIDSTVIDSYNQQKKNFMDGARSLIDQREFISRRQNMSEKMLDKQQLERD